MLFRKTAVAASLAVLLGSACGGKSLTKIDSEAVLPKELEDQFAVRTADAFVPVPESVVVPATPQKKSKKSKAAKSTEFKYPNRRPLNDPIYLGESLTYDITFYGVSAGEVVLTQQPFKMVNNRKVYHIKADIRSSKVFSLVYRLNDTVESFWDYEGLFSHRYHMILDEKVQTRDSLELYDSVKAQTFYWNRWNHETKGYVETKEFQPITPFSQDAISILFYTRMIPLQVGQTVSIPAVAEGKTWEIRTTVLRKEPKSTPLGKRDCYVLKPEVWREGKPQNKGEVYLWVTDDENRYPVHLEAKVRIGTVHMSLSNIAVGTRPDTAQPELTAVATPAPEISDTPSPLPTIRK